MSIHNGLVYHNTGYKIRENTLSIKAFKSNIELTSGIYYVYNGIDNLIFKRTIYGMLTYYIFTVFPGKNNIRKLLYVL